MLVLAAGNEDSEGNNTEDRFEDLNSSFHSCFVV
jgi:hypothetical protein